MVAFACVTIAFLNIKEVEVHGEEDDDEKYEDEEEDEDEDDDEDEEENEDKEGVQQVDQMAGVCQSWREGGLRLDFS